MDLKAAQLDRACGVLLGSAVGDALGAGYEFGAASYDGWPAMVGGGLGGFAPGEWTDDTAQAMAIAGVAATGADLRTTEALDAIAQGFADWFASGPADVGIQTSQVLALAGPNPSAASMTAAAEAVHRRTGRSAGNGSLMRTAPVALAHLDDPAALVEAAMKISALTHHQDIAREGAALWCLMIRRTVLDGALPDARRSVNELEKLLGRAGATDWRALLEQAETKPPKEFSQNGWVVGALQAAWSAVVHTPVPDDFACRHLQEALATAIGIGHDTDTVAAIAGALLGARWGVSGIPSEWRSTVHGWPGLRAQDLVHLAQLTTRGGRPDRSGWPNAPRLDYRHMAGWDACVPHPHDDGVWIGGVGALETLPEGVDAVVTLCRVGSEQVPTELRDRHEVFRLIDTHDRDNPNVDFVIDDAARAVRRLREQGRTVLLHCVAGHSRTPTVAARYAVLRGVPLATALSDVVGSLPYAGPNSSFRAALRRLDEIDRRGRDG